MKKVLSFILATLMLISVFSLVACDYEKPDDLEESKGLIYEEIKGELWVAGVSATCKDTEIVIPDYVKMNKKNKKVVGIKAGAFEGEEQITKIAVPSTVKEIGANAFANCPNLQEVYIDKGVEWLRQSILYNSYAKIVFNGTSKEFQSIEHYNNLGAWYYDKFVGKNKDHYVYCTDVILIYNLGDGDNCPRVESYEKASKGLEYTLNDDGESYSVTGIGTCKDTDIIIPSMYNGKPVTIIGDEAFFRCSLLTSIEIPDSVTNIGYGAFSNCEAITNVIIPHSVTTVGDWAFSCCTSLTSIEIPDSVTSIGGWAFMTCGHLTNITIPNSVTNIGRYAFQYCDDLSNITFKGTKAQWHGISKTSDWDSNTGNYTIYCTDGTISKSDDGANNNASKGLEFVLNVDGKGYSLVGIGSCTDTEIVIPSTYNGLPVTFVGDAFVGNSFITSVVIPDTVIIISGSFKMCTALTYVDLPDSLQTIGNYTFLGCTSLKSILIPNTVIGIGDGAFGGCTSLQSVMIPNSVIEIGGNPFGGCTSLASIHVDSNNAYYKSIDGNLYTKDGQVFIQYVSTNKKDSFTIPNHVTTIKGCAFQNAVHLSSVFIPDSVITIEDLAFTGLSNITIYCKFQSKPNGWNEYWNRSFYSTKIIELPVVWGYEN